MAASTPSPHELRETIIALQRGAFPCSQPQSGGMTTNAAMRAETRETARKMQAFKTSVLKLQIVLAEQQKGMNEKLPKSEPLATVDGAAPFCVDFVNYKTIAAALSEPDRRHDVPDPTLSSINEALLRAMQRDHAALLSLNIQRTRGGVTDTPSQRTEGGGFPAVQWPLPPAELRVQGRRRRDEEKRLREERARRRRQRLMELQLVGSSGAEGGTLGKEGSTVAARILCAATGGAALFDLSPIPVPVAAAAGDAAPTASPSLPVALKTRGSAAGGGQTKGREGVKSSHQGSPRRARSSSTTEPASPITAGTTPPLGLSGIFTTLRSGSAPHGRWHDEASHKERSLSARAASEAARDIHPTDTEDGGAGDGKATPVSFVLRSPGSSGFYFSSTTSGSDGVLGSGLYGGNSGASSSPSFSSTDSVFAFHKRRHQKARQAADPVEDTKDHHRNARQRRWPLVNPSHVTSSPTSTLFNGSITTTLGTTASPRDDLSHGTPRTKRKGNAEGTPQKTKPSVPARKANSLTDSASVTQPTQSLTKEEGSDGSGGEDDDGLDTHATALEEMDAIEQGRADPYKAYLFSPHARMTDVQRLFGGRPKQGIDAPPLRTPVIRPEATAFSTSTAGGAQAAAAQPQWSRAGDTTTIGNTSANDPRATSCASTPSTSTSGAAAPPIEATCVSFSPAGTCYLVGCSQGALLHFPVASVAEGVTHTTYLGSLQRGGGPRNDGGAYADWREADSWETSPSSDGQHKDPTVLSMAHSAAVTALAFSDDGGMFASSSADGSVMLWSVAKLTKLRRLRVGHPASAAAHAATAMARTAIMDSVPHYVLFTPFNNNYVLVCSRRAGVLYNGSTGLPVVARQHKSSNSSGGGSIVPDGASDGVPEGSITGVRRKSHAATPSFLTSVCMDARTAPFFFLGDSQGNVQMCTYRAGDITPLPTLGAQQQSAAAAAAAELSGSAHVGAEASLLMGGGGGRSPGAPTSPLTRSQEPLGIAHSRQLPELRRLAHLSLDNHAGLAALSQRAACREGSSGVGSGGPSRHGSFSAPFYPIAQLEVGVVNAQQCLSLLKAQQRLVPSRDEQREMGLWPASEAERRQRALEQEKQLRQQLGKKVLAGNASSATTTRTPQTGVGASEHGLRDVSNKIAGVFSSFLNAATHALGTGSSGRGEGDNGGPSAVDQSTPTLTVTGTASHASVPASLQQEALRLCPLTLIATQPCDTVSVIGVLVEFPFSSETHEQGQPQRRKHDKRQRSRTHAMGAARCSPGAPVGPPVYTLVRLLDIRGLCRLRHVGVGAVAARDNPRLLTLAIPCEEGFVRLVSNSVVERPVSFTTPDVCTAGHTSTTTGSGTALKAEVQTVLTPTVLAALPMPCGGRCRGLAWSPDSRFLIAVTHEGVVYQWERIYLIGEHITTTDPRTAFDTLSSPMGGPVSARAATNRLSTTAIGTGSQHSLQQRQGGLGGRHAEFPSDLLSGGHSDAPPRSSRGYPCLAVPATGGNTASAAATAGWLETEEERWRESLFRERLRQLDARRLRKLNDFKGVTSGLARGSHQGSMESSGYWLEGEFDDEAGTSTASSSPSPSADSLNAPGNDPSTND